jgi:hypothetical protein
MIDDATSFALALGGRLDVRAGRNVHIRLIQADYLPTFFGSTLRRRRAFKQHSEYVSSDG